MKVKLLSMTENPIDLMWTAARTCYSEKSPIEMWDETLDEPKEEYKEEIKNRRWNLVKTVLASGHQSIAEYVNFVFAIEGVDRALTHQLVRHRIAVFSQQSQRYVEFKESFDTISELFENPKTDKDEDYLLCVAEKYFTGVTKDNYRMYIQCLISYLQGIKLGMKPEEARTFLPNATKTNIMMGINLRELMHVCNLRLCTRAQKPIRTLFNEIVKCVKERDEKIGSLLVPTCEVNGFCTEHKCCGRKPTLKEITNLYKISQDEVISQEDFNQLVDSTLNPKVNENIRKLLQMKSVIEE